jgi:hypothetical protein
MMSCYKNAVCVGEKWLCYVTTEKEHVFTVHSVFDKVINISAAAQMLSVAANGIGGSSAFLVLPDKAVDLGVLAGERCVIQAGRLVIGSNTISFDNAPLWRGPVSKEYKHKVIKKDNIAAFKAVLDRKAAAESAWSSVNSDAESRFQGLKAIKELRQNPFLARNLIGLGIGLTPAGDDMILGFLAMVNHTCENEEYVSELHNAVSDSLPNTVDFSKIVLANALDYDYHELIQNCIRDLCEGEKENVYISAASLINIGATSGSDIACGMYFGMID